MTTLRWIISLFTTGMKIIRFDLKFSQNPVILELQIYCKKLILSAKETGIVNLFELNKRMQSHALLISLNHPVSEYEDIHYKVHSSLTFEEFTLIYSDKVFVSLVSRKPEFELAFKDLDCSRNN